MKGLAVLLNPRIHCNSLNQLFTVFFRYRQQIREMTRAGIPARHSGHTFGALWPVVQVCIFIFAAVFFNNRYGDTAELRPDYTAFLLSGLIPWLAMQESLGKSPTVDKLEFGQGEVL